MKSIKQSSLFLAVIALFVVMASPSQAGYGAGGYGEAGRLVIRYSPTTGIDAAMRVFINGRGAGGITKGHTYVAYLPPGRHLVTVARNGRGFESSDMVVNIYPGQTSSFLAKHRANEMLLVPAFGARSVMAPQF